MQQKIIITALIYTSRHIITGDSKASIGAQKQQFENTKDATISCFRN